MVEDYDVAIVGAGAVGSALATSLGRSGLRVALIDRHEEYPDVFKAERIGVAGVDRMRDMDVLKYAESVMVRTPQVTNYRHSAKVLFQEKSGDYAFHHSLFTRELQKAAKSFSEFIVAAAQSVEIDAEGKREISLSNGRTIRARALVLATGISREMQKLLNLDVECYAKNFSFIYGGNLYLKEKQQLDFPMNVFRNYHSDKGVAYLLVFQLQDCIRYNHFTYWDTKDPRRKRMNAGSDSMCEMIVEGIPYLREVIGDFSVDEKPAGASISLTQVQGSEDAGVFLIGDASGRGCPAYGYGLIKGMNDAAILAEDLPRWLANPSAVAGREQVAAFTSNPLKVGYDEQGKSGSLDCRGRVFGGSRSATIKKARTLATPGWVYPIVGHLRSLRPPEIPL